MLYFNFNLHDSSFSSKSNYLSISWLECVLCCINYGFSRFVIVTREFHSPTWERKLRNYDQSICIQKIQYVSINFYTCFFVFPLKQIVAPFEFRSKIRWSLLFDPPRSCGATSFPNRARISRLERACTFLRAGTRPPATAWNGIRPRPIGRICWLVTGWPRLLSNALTLDRSGEVRLLGVNVA